MNRSVRFLALLLAVIGAAGVLGKLWLAGSTERELSAPTLSAEVAVAGWMAVPVEVPPYRAPEMRRFIRAEPEITLEFQFIPDLPTHYVGNPQLQERYLHRGEVPLEPGLRFTANSHGQIIPNSPDTAPRLVSIEPQADGSAFWEMDGLLHLSTLAAPNGDHGCSRPALSRSMFFRDLTAARLLGWLRGRVDFPDTRCVLIHLSLPVSALPREEARAVLRRSLDEWRRARPFVFPGREAAH